MIVDGSNYMRVRQLNAARRVITHDTLMAWLNATKHPYILCLQEPYITARGLSRLPSAYCAFYNNVDKNKYARVCIIAPKGLGGYMITQFSSRNCVIVRFPTLKSSFASVYCDIHEEVTEAFNGVSLEISKGNDIIVCVDSNAHNKLWGSLGSRATRIRSFHRGDRLGDMFDEWNLHVCNEVPHKPTYVGGTGHMTHIDITLCSWHIVNRVYEWAVSNECYESDHQMIEFKVRIHADPPCRIVQEGISIPWKKPSKEMIHRMEWILPKLIKFRRRVGDQEDVDMFLQRHVEEIQQALGKIFNKKEKRERPCYWWTSEVSQLHAKMKKARRRMGRYRYNNLIQEYNECRKAFRQKVKETKISAWRKFMSEVEDPWKGLFRILGINNTKATQSKTLCSLDGVYAEDLKGTLALLGRQFYPEPVSHLQIHEDTEKEVERQIASTEGIDAVTIHELRKALGEMKKATAPGSDTITNCVLRILVDKCGYGNQYLEIINACLRYSHCPAMWKQADIVLIPKQFDTLNSVKALRPISLTSVFSKMMERVVLARILHYIQLSGKLSTRQHAYRKGGSTTTALYEVTNFIQDSLHDRQVCMIVFLDISGAFDRTWHGGILYRMLQYGVPTYLVRWIRSFLANRRVNFKEGGEEHEKQLAQGCPQGGVLSPVLWNILFNDMLTLKMRANQEFHLRVVGYADDAAVLCRSKNPKNASVILTKYLRKIQKWAVENRVQMNKSKMNVMTISRNPVTQRAAVFYEGILVNEVTRYKYLGLIFDNRLSWKPHVHQMLGKLEDVTRSLRGAVRESWGVRMHVMRMIFKTVFCPILLYGVAIWGWRMTGTAACARFDRVIRKFCIMSTRCFKSTSNDVLLRFMRTTRFSNLARQEVLKVVGLQLNLIKGDRDQVYNKEYMRKRMAPISMHHYFHMCKQGLRQELKETVYEDVEHYYSAHPKDWIETNACIKDRIGAVWDNSRREGWRIYTDASVSSYGAGWAFTAYHHGFCECTQGSAISSCAVFFAEAQAIKHAAIYAMNVPNLRRSEIIEICSDSQAVIRALGKMVVVDPVLGSVKQVLNIAHRKGVNIRLQWVPSHLGIEGNEWADMLAKEAVDLTKVQRVTWVKRDLKTEIKNRIRKTVAQQWDKVNSVVPKLFFPKVDCFHAFLKSHPSAQLCQLVTGHCRLNEFMCVKMRAVVSSVKCACRKADETVWHYLVECPLYEQARYEVWEDTSIRPSRTL